MKDVCAACGKEVSGNTTVVLSITGQIYCSEVCRKHDSQVKCGFCGKALPDVEEIDNYTQFCSKDCQGKYVDKAFSEA